MSPHFSDNLTESLKENLEKTPESLSRIPCAIVGASGYSGRELARILLKHPRAELVCCYTTGPSASLAVQLPERSAKAVQSYPISDLATDLAQLKFKVVFLATPVNVSIDLAAKILEFGVDVIDLSGAFRLKAGSTADITEIYESWYQLHHPAPALVQIAQYGLVPWATAFAQQREPSARLIANPGCYATAVLLGLLPLLKNQLILLESVVIDAKSGTTGAGKKAEEHLLQAEIAGLCLPYRIGKHQHQPEIEQFAKLYSGSTIDPHFTPHLLNVRRGIIAGIYARLAPGVNQEAIARSYQETYGSDPLIECASADVRPELLNLRRVVGSARTQISFQVEDKKQQNKIYVFSLIDNLLKGAASQAVENFNRLIQQPTHLGLTDLEGVL